MPRPTIPSSANTQKDTWRDSPGEKEIKNDNEYEVFTLPLDIAEKNYYKIEGVCELLWNDGSFGYRPAPVLICA